MELFGGIMLLVLVCIIAPVTVLLLLIESKFKK